MRAPSIAFFRCVRRTESGVAIILAILTLALIASVASFILRDYGASVDSISGRHDQAQAQLLARGAIDWARNVLAEDARSNAIDYTGEHWALRVPPTAVEDGEVGGYIDDVSGRFDLNSLTTGGIANQQQIAVYKRLLNDLGMSPQESARLTNSLVDWIDADNFATPSGEAEKDRYLQQTPQTNPANASLTDVDELSLIHGYSAEVIDLLRPYVIALPISAPLNVNTASAEVLAATIPELNLDDARALVIKRRLLAFKDMGDFVSRLPNSGSTPDTKKLGVTSRFFVASGQARYGNAVTRMQVLLDRKNTWPEIVWQKIL